VFDKPSEIAVVSLAQRDPHSYNNKVMHPESVLASSYNSAADMASAAAIMGRQGTKRAKKSFMSERVPINSRMRVNASGTTSRHQGLRGTDGRQKRKTTRGLWFARRKVFFVSRIGFPRHEPEFDPSTIES
jgi:hypothetical protein